MELLTTTARTRAALDMFRMGLFDSLPHTSNPFHSIISIPFCRRIDMSYADRALLGAAPGRAAHLPPIWICFWAMRLRGHCRRILVIDADILYEHGDPARLMRANMLGHGGSGGARQPAVAHTRAQRWPNSKSWADPPHPYFNAGVVMIDTEGFAAEDLPARSGRFAHQPSGRAWPRSGADERHAEGRLGRDQPAVELAIHQCLGASDIDGRPCLIHSSARANRGWPRQGIVPMRIRAAFGGSWPAFPHVPPVPQADAPLLAHPGALRAALFRQWRAAGAMTRYLNRFSRSLRWSIRRLRSRNRFLASWSRARSDRRADRSPALGQLQFDPAVAGHGLGLSPAGTGGYRQSPPGPDDSPEAQIVGHIAHHRQRPEPGSSSQLSR